MPPISPPDPHTMKFLTALDEFMESQPAGLPEGATDNLKALGQHLRGYSGQAETPGEAETQKAYTDGTGEHFKKAALGEDQPSPGQREFAAAMEQMQAQVQGA